MRTLGVYKVVSLDGYHMGSGNDVSVMFPMMGGVFDTYNAELLRSADTLQVAGLPSSCFTVSGSRSRPVPQVERKSLPRP
jgi:hypothetical protein